MKSRVIFVVALFLWLLPGCRSTRELETPTLSSEVTSTLSQLMEQTITPTENATQTVEPIETSIPESTIQPESTTTSTSTITPTSSASFIEKRCGNVIDALPTGAILEGSLFLDTRPVSPSRNQGIVYRMILQTGDIQLIADAEESFKKIPEYGKISPDQKKYFYEEVSPLSGQKEIVVLTLNDQEVMTIPWNQEWGGVTGWLDNDLLRIRPANYKRDGKVIVLDLTSGEWQTLSPTFPSGLNIDFPAVLYNPSLTKAIYFSGDFYVLLDVQSEKDLWRRGGIVFHTPADWSPDGRWFVMDVANNENDIIHHELFLVNPDGHEEKLTHLAETYPDMSGIYIESFFWSPDGNFIAVQGVMRPEASNDVIPLFFVVDIQSKQMIDYCVDVGSRPVWSPDSKQIAISIPINYQEYIRDKNLPKPLHFNIVLIDISSGQIFQIAEDMVPIAWMIEP